MGFLYLSLLAPGLELEILKDLVEFFGREEDAKAHEIIFDLQEEEIFALNRRNFGEVGVQKESEIGLIIFVGQITSPLGEQFVAPSPNPERGLALAYEAALA